MKIYISGKITGLNIDVARNLFDVTQQEVQKLGHTAINPMECVPFNPDWSWEQYMIEDIKLLFGCDAILMLPNWYDSKGARIEQSICHEMGKKIYYRITDVPHIMDHSHIVNGITS